MQEDDDDEDKEFEPKTQTENAGDGGGSNRPTRIGASTPDDSRRRKRIPWSPKPRKLGPYRRPEPLISSLEDTHADRSKCIQLQEELITVRELAKVLEVSDTEVIKQLFMMGFPRTVSQTIDMDLARKCAIDMGYTIDQPDAENPADTEV